MTRLDVRSKVMGELQFGIDLKMDGMLYASVKLNPNKGQPMKSYDARKARSMPGVKKILKVKNGVAVIATNSWYAMQAVAAIDCKWAPSVYPAEQAGHWKILEASFKPEFLGKQWRNIGDVEAASKSGTIVEAEYRAPYVAISRWSRSMGLRLSPTARWKSGSVIRARRLCRPSRRRRSASSRSR